MSGFVLKFGHYTASFSANVAARSIQTYFWQHDESAQIAAAKSGGLG